MMSDNNPRLGAITRGSDFHIHADGASAIIVCPTDIAQSFSDHPVAVTGLGVATSIMYHCQGVDWEPDAAAFAQAFDMANIDASKDVDYMYVHDAQVSHQFVGAETAGFIPRGEGWKAIMEGRTAVTGDKPINTSGGRTAMGHAYAASVGAEIAEAVWQMRGDWATTADLPGPRGERRPRPGRQVPRSRRVGSKVDRSTPKTKMQPYVKMWYEYFGKERSWDLRCNGCGAYECPPVPVCSECAGIDLTWTELSGEGELTAFKVVLHRG